MAEHLGIHRAAYLSHNSLPDPIVRVLMLIMRSRIPFALLPQGPMPLCTKHKSFLYPSTFTRHQNNHPVHTSIFRNHYQALENDFLLRSWGYLFIFISWNLFLNQWRVSSFNPHQEKQRERERERENPIEYGARLLQCEVIRR